MEADSGGREAIGILADGGESFRKKLIAWFRGEGRDYPWRRTEDPYAILVSEIMLQQTQIATVLGPKRYYERWLERFPDAGTLAAAPEEAVLKEWEGLGYYSRARNLQRAARMVVEDCGGEFPRTAEEIRKLPGVGRYTAGAVASFAFDAAEPIVDANVARVLARLFDFRERIDDDDAGQKQIWEWAGDLVRGAAGGRDFNSALMELGQRICTPKTPRCELCPVRAFCRAETPETLPVKKPRTKTEHVDEHVLYVEKDGGLLLVRESEGRRRKGLWKLPGRELEEVGDLPLLLKMKYSITHYRVTLRIYAGGAGIAAGKGEEWVSHAKIESLPMASPYRKALGQCRTEFIPFPPGEGAGGALETD